MNGYVNSIQSLGTVDGPGVRFVVFFQGCNLRCGCCHNPDTWEVSTGKTYSHTEIAEMAERYREYYKDNGGITLSGGEPLLQARFAGEIFKTCKTRGINTCLDTSGSILSEEVKVLLDYTDRVLLDIKYTKDELYKKYVGCSLDAPLMFLDYLNKSNIPTTLRQVIIPSLNDDEESVKELVSIAENHICVDKIEILPFKKICKVKYDNLNLRFKFEHLPECPKDDIEKLERIIGKDF